MMVRDVTTMGEVSDGQVLDGRGREGVESSAVPSRVTECRAASRRDASREERGFERGGARPASSMMIAWFAVSKRCTAGTVAVTLASGGDGKCACTWRRAFTLEFLEGPSFRSF
jgi:hypothetical protein